MMLRFSDRRSTRRAPVIAALLALVLLLVACTPEQQAIGNHVNDSRRAVGGSELYFDAYLNEKAQAWAEHLARIGRLEHSHLPQGTRPGWRKLGENVGRGPSIAAVHQGFMGSPGHRANVLDPSFTHMGTGAAVGANGVVYVVQVFATY